MNSFLDAHMEGSFSHCFSTMDEQYSLLSLSRSREELICGRYKRMTLQ